MRIRFVLALALALTACQGERPAATSTPAGAAQAPAEPAATSVPAASEQQAVRPDTEGWERVEWAGLTIPVPPDHTGQAVQMVDRTIHGAHVVESFAIALKPELASGCCELPSGFLLDIVEFQGEPREWVMLTDEANRLSVDPATVRETTVAGRPALVYNPIVTGTGIRQSYVVRLDDQRLLLIDTDVAYEEYESVIRGIRG
jgi:hypothetical protein